MQDNVTIKAYGRTELALMYFPQSSPEAAWRRLKSWMARCRPLSAALSALAYDGRRRGFTPAEVEAIFRWLGEP